MRFEPLARFDTELTACSTEISADAAGGRYVACGLYQNAVDPAAPLDVESPKTKRTGRLLIYRDDDEGVRVGMATVMSLSSRADA